jgi:putative ABC transport system permease protein
METMQQRANDLALRPRFNATVLGSFAGLAVLLAAVGLYGVVSFLVTERTHEIGIRVALGAQHSDVMKLVVGHGMIMTVVGVTMGLAGALGLTGFVSSLLFGVKPTDPLTFVVVPTILAAVSLLATYIPARRAAKCGPHGGSEI